MADNNVVDITAKTAKNDPYAAMNALEEALGLPITEWQDE